MMIHSLLKTFALLLTLVASARGVFNGIEESDGESEVHLMFQTDEAMNAFAISLPKILPDQRVYLEEIEAAEQPRSVESVPSSFFSSPHEVKPKDAAKSVQSSMRSREWVTMTEFSGPNIPIPTFNSPRQYFNGSFRMYYPSLPVVPSRYFTVSVWINTIAATSWITTLGRTPANYNGELLFGIANGKLKFWEYYNGYGLNFIGKTNVNTGKRTLVTFVKNDTAGYLFVNGVLDASSTTTATIAYKNVGFNVGNDCRDNVKYFKGWMDNLNVYQQGLSTSQVAAVYSNYLQAPTAAPSFAPTAYPTNPTFAPTFKPSFAPSVMPPTVSVTMSGVNYAPSLGFQIINAMVGSDATEVSGHDLRYAYMKLATSLNDTRQEIIANVFRDATSQSKLNSITWNIGHDSVYFKIIDSGNTHGLMMSNYDYSTSTYSTTHVPIAVAGFYQSSSRYSAFGNNPFAVPLATHQSVVLKNVITWMNRGVDPSTISDFGITIAHLPGKSSYWFSHDIPTHSWFNENYPMAKINGINTCDNDALDKCLANSKLLVISLQMDRTDDTAVFASKTNATKVTQAVRNFMESGGSVMYVHYYRVGNEITDVLLPLMGLQALGHNTYTNYWRKAGLNNADPYQYVEGAFDNIYRAIQTLHGDSSLVTSDLCTGVSEWTSCSSSSEFNRKIKFGVDSIRSTLSEFDNRDFDLFGSSINNYVLEKIIVLLGDKYRTAVGTTDPMTSVVKYPLKLENFMGLSQFMFADSSILYRRNNAPAQDDLGSVYCSTWNTLLGPNGCADYQTFASKVTRYNDLIVEDAGVYTSDVWTTTGAFAIPGVPFNVTRLDKREDIILYIAIWYQRSGSTKSLDFDGKGNYQYNRPQFLRSSYILLTTDKEITITAPHGGPIYFGLVNSGVTASSFPPLKCLFNNVGRHPTLDAGNDAQINAFPLEVKSNPIPIVDIKAPGMEIHMRSDYLLSNLKALDEFQDYSGPDGMTSMLNNIRFNFLEAQMTLAGFKAPGKQLSESLPETVQSACQALDWNCTDSAIHTFRGIQHANYDERASCGAGCSGNPFDMDWSINPLGWGEAHELGHNMQQSLLQISWLPAGSSRDVWNNYQNRASENSNNIFPFHNQWRYIRVVKNYTGIVSKAWTGLVHDYVTLQSAIARVNKTIAGELKTVVYDKKCAIVNKYPTGTSAERVAQDAVYADGSYAANNDARMAFYLQLPFIMTGQSVAQGKVILNNGFEIITLLYQGLRTFKHFAKTPLSWNQNRDLIGFGLFNHTCAIADSCYGLYGGKSVVSMTGNDFVLVMLTFITGYDFRPFFDIRGLRYSVIADKQVSAHVTSHVAFKGPVPTDYYGIDDFPQANLLAGRVRKLPLDGVSSWPFTGWSVLGCASA